MRPLPVLIAAVLAVLPARAHSPHDVSNDVAVSPAYADDQTVFGAFLLTDHSLLGRSTDAGRSWQLYGTPFAGDTEWDLVLSPAFADDDTMFAATATMGVYRSTDRGTSWTAVDAGLTDLRVERLAVSPTFATDGLVLAVTPTGCFRSTDGGLSWAPSDTGLTETPLTVVAFGPPTASPPVAFAGGEVVHRSDDGGQTWTALGVPGQPMDSLVVSPGWDTDQTLAVAFGRFEDGASISTDGGATFTPMVDGLTDLWINDLVFAPDGSLFCVARTQACYRADAPLAPWTLFDAGFEELSTQALDHYKAVAVSPAFATDGQVFVAAFEGLFRSDDGGQLWTQRNVYSQLVNRHVRLPSSFAADGRVFVGNYGGAVYTTGGAGEVPGGALGAEAAAGAGPAAPSPGGGGGGGPLRPLAPPPDPGLAAPRAVWDARADDVDSLYTDTLVLSPFFADDRTVLYAHVGLYRSRDAGLTWERLVVDPGVTVVRCAAFSPDFDLDATIFCGTSKEGTWRSTDGGDTWLAVDADLPASLRTSEIVVSPAFLVDRTVVMGSKGDGVFVTTDAGDTWTASNAGLPNLDVRALAISPAFDADGRLFAGTVGDGPFVSDDGGASWTPSNAGLPDNAPVVVESIALSPGWATDATAFLATRDDGVFVSTDGGATWDPVGPGLPLSTTRALAVSPAFPRDETLFAAGFDWVWRSTDAGASWQPLPGYARTDDGHPTVVREGAWSEELDPLSHAGAVAVSTEAGARETLEFRGDSITWYATRDDTSGRARVRLDGAAVAVLDLSAETASSQQAVFARTFDDVGWHVIEVVNEGVGGAVGGGTAVRSDGFAFTF